MNYYNEIDPYAAQWLRNLIDAGAIAPGVVIEGVRKLRAQAQQTTEPELPWHAGRLTGCPDDDLDGTLGYTADQMHDHYAAGVRAGMGQSQDAKLEPLVREALRKAFSFGQRYWQQADSEYASDHKKSNETQLKFLALIEETIAAMQGDSQ